ncbi:hypothetical protein [Acanthopleuribacter pedis]|uniref:Nucleotidyltransferase domain-containing protein n=1 Tax=Acanthopleuribacter pedis TaxID=442870 RepID=A0A8J7PZ75_9BACT|nr:hypothetical protein [Acanthopleuribacter pedis]MBO1317407.1 hypothetical protein [Acanthopleuribacter pedis]
MDHTEVLENRLQAIAKVLTRRPDALCLLGLGSVGRERARLDRYSDLDFFVIVAPGAKAGYLSSLDWLTQLGTVVFSFANTDDGCKLLYEDGVFCEFAVFEPHELAGIPFCPGRIIWRRVGFDETLVIPKMDRSPQHKHAPQWLLGEILSNLLVGLSRECRGERLAAFKMIQVYALDHLLTLIEISGHAPAALRDPFNNDRRFEQRFPDCPALLAQFAPGYVGNVAAAEAMLDYLAPRYEVSAGCVARIRALCREAHAKIG